MNYGKPIRVIAVTATSDAFKHELVTVAEGQCYELIVTPLDMQTPGLGIFRLETDCPLEKHRLQQVFATVYKPTTKL